MPVEDAVLRKRLLWIGTAILLAGLLSAALVFLAAPTDSKDSDALEIGRSKHDLDQMERIGGKSVIVGVEFDDWIGSLWHGRRLAYTLTFISVGSSIACFFLAHRLSFPLPLEHQPGSKG
jgi:hypothetical protein